MRQELGTRLTELQVAQNAQKAARDQLDRVTHELDIKNRSVDALTHDREQHLSQIQELLSCKALLEEKVSDLKMELEQVKTMLFLLIHILIYFLLILLRNLSLCPDLSYS